MARICKTCKHPAKRHVGECDIPEGGFDITWMAKYLGMYHECGGNPIEGTPCDCEEFT